MKLFMFIAIAVLLSSCSFSKKEKTESKENQLNATGNLVDKEKNDTIFRDQFSEEDMPLELIAISKEEFLLAKKNEFVMPHFQKITDINQVQNLLKDVVTFEKLGHESVSYGIRHIRFANGGIHEVKGDIDESFLAYYPSEKILLCEGGHTSDVSYHLETGKMTDDVGNPDYIKSSPNAKYRINGFYTGHDCTISFIEKWNGAWQKTIDLEGVFQYFKGYWLCWPKDYFWTDDETMYFEVIDSHEPLKYYSYFKGKIKPTEPHWNREFEKMPITKFPLEVNIGADNRHYQKLDFRVAKSLLAGLIPQAERVKFVHRLAFSEQFTSVIVTFGKGDSEFFAYLFNIDKKGEVIDYMEVSYDEVAESAMRSYAKITKDKIIITHENDFAETKSLSEYRISPQGFFIPKR